MARQNLKSRAMGYLSRVLERMLTDEKRAAKVARAVGAVQKGRERIDRAQEGLLRAMNFATRADYRDLGKRISAIKRRARHLAERLEKSTQSGALG